MEFKIKQKSSLKKKKVEQKKQDKIFVFLCVPSKTFYRIINRNLLFHFFFIQNLHKTEEFCQEFYWLVSSNIFKTFIF